MATAKQLAALAKARKARAEKSAKKTAPKKTRNKKTTARKTKAPVRKSPQIKCVVEVKLNSGKIGYLTSFGGLDTDKAVAGKFTPAVAEKKARDFFAENKKYLQHVRVVEIKKR